MIGGKILIKIDNISFSYSSQKIFENLSLNLEKGKFYVLLGKNGSGKSTLIKLLLGIEKAENGKILIDNMDLEKNLYECRKNMGMVFQNPDEQIVSENIEEELVFSMTNYSCSSFEMKERALEILKDINLFEKKEVRVSQLSGGEKQRLCIGSALMLKPKILILDESTAMLDEKNRELIFKLLERVKNEGTTIILITHHLNEIEYADEIIYLESKKIKWIGEKNIFLKKIIGGELGERLELSPNFYIAKQLYQKKRVDITSQIFNSEEVAECLLRYSFKK